MHRIRTATTATVVRGQLAATAVGDRLADGAQRRLDPLRDDPERGAQAAEYAMLGGVSAAACGGLIYLLQEDGVLRPVVEGVIDLLVRAIGSWLS